MNPHLEKIYNQITSDLAQALFKLLADFNGHEPEICRLMTAQLGSLIAVTAKDPEKALAFYATRLANFNWQEVRSDYFANTLGVDNTKPVGRQNPESKVHYIGKREARDPALPAETTGNPLAQKPD